MSVSLYSFVDVEAKTASPSTIREIVKSVLRENNGACYADLERYLMPPGVSGSRAFDQAYAVTILLRHDDNQKKQIATAMENTPTLTHRALWDVLQTVLRGVGFKMQHGRLVGVLEDKRTAEEKAEAGQPDID